VRLNQVFRLEEKRTVSNYTIPELAEMWKFSKEFVRQIARGEPGVTEWVRQRPGRRRYRVIRVPQSVVERLYRRALTRAEQEGSSGQQIAVPTASDALPSRRRRF
jgi:hypothetical protein